MQLSNALKSTLTAAVLGVLALGLVPTSAFATTTNTANFTVSATVAATCSISAGAMTFPSYVGAVTTAQSTITVQCTTSTPYNIGLNQGVNGGSVTTRQMKSGTTTLNYGLYRDAAWTLNWGVTTGTDTLAGTGSGTSQSINVYGQIPANQYAPAATYTDTIVASITY